MVNPLKKINCVNNHETTLDALIRVKKRGNYECIDCFTDKYNNLQLNLFSELDLDNTNNLSNSKIKKLISWCLG